jgi:hypothetical protein
MTKTACVCLIFLTSGLSIGGPNQESISQMEGYYIEPAKTCSVLQGRVLKPCNPPRSDCLLIKRIDDSHAWISFRSMQTNGHSCAVSGLANFRNGKFTYTERDSDSPDLGRGISIRRLGHLLKLSYLVRSGMSLTAFCGMRASVENVEFQDEQKQPVGSHTCTSEDAL